MTEKLDRPIDALKADLEAWENQAGAARADGREPDPSLLRLIDNARRMLAAHAGAADHDRLGGLT